MDVSGGVDSENRDIYMYKQNGGKHQQWDLVYKKDWKGEPKTGELNGDFGLLVNKDFHVVSVLGTGKYLDFFDSKKNLVIKTQNGRRTQLWYFHQSSRTIRSRSTNTSWDIHNKGGSKHMQVYSTSSNWW